MDWAYVMSVAWGSHCMADGHAMAVPVHGASRCMAVHGGPSAWVVQVHGGFSAWRSRCMGRQDHEAVGVPAAHPLLLPPHQQTRTHACDASAGRWVDTGAWETRRKASEV
eukprot:350959-Chlamydomonas_euryale.AAC.2